MPESKDTRLELIRADVHSRLRDACSRMERKDYETMVTNMAEIHFRYEQQAPYLNAETAVPLMSSREPSVAQPPSGSRVDDVGSASHVDEVSPRESVADDERTRRLWVKRPVSVLLPRDRPGERHRRH